MNSKIEQYIKHRDFQLQQMMKTRKLDSKEVASMSDSKIDLTPAPEPDIVSDSVRFRRQQFLKASFTKIQQDPVFFKNNQEQIIREIVETLREIK